MTAYLTRTLFVSFWLLSFAVTAQASQVTSTQSPYLMVHGAPAGVDGLPLKLSHAEVNIAGVIAKVRVTQVYRNLGTKPLEAIYVFPGSTRAAVFGMSMQVGDRKVVAKIQTHQQARKIYEAAKQEGKTASLLEQHRPNVFQMNVGNILPGDEIKVVLDYTELLVPTDGTYEFNYPAVVGPRFVDREKSSANDNWTATPYTPAGRSASYDWDLQVNLAAGVKPADIASPSHGINTQFTGSTDAKIALKDTETGGNRDFVLQYKLSGNKTQTGMLMYPGKEENFFLMMVQPPKKVTLKEMPSREYVFVVDVSGSMRGFPIETAKRVLGGLMDNLRPQDTFNVVLFSGGNRVMSPRSLPASPANIANAMRTMSGMRGGGHTRLLPALRTALAMPASDATSRTFVVVTDGYVAVEAEAFDLIRNNLNKANLFAFGIGSSVNRHLIEGMARAGMGEPFIVLGNKQVDSTVSRFQSYISSPALTNIKVKFKGFKAYDVEPKAIGDLFAEKPVVVFGKYRGKATGQAVVTGQSGKGQFVRKVNIANATSSSKHESLRYLWARHRIMQLSDNASRPGQQARGAEAITGLGLKYNLMTKYTSFVAVDNVVRTEGNGTATTVKQPLPMPQGVPNSAVGVPKSQALYKFTGSGAGGMGFGGGRIGGGGYGSKRKVRSYSGIRVKSGTKRAKTRGYPSRMAPSRSNSSDEASPRKGNIVSKVTVLTHYGHIAGHVLVSKVMQQLETIRACTGSIGPVVVRVRIDASGAIQSILPVAATPRRATVSRCVLKALKSLHFGSRSGATEVRLLIRL